MICMVGCLAQLLKLETAFALALSDTRETGIIDFSHLSHSLLPGYEARKAASSVPSAAETDDEAKDWR